MSLCFSVGHSKEGPRDEALKLHAVVEFHSYEIHDESDPVLASIDILGLFLVETSDSGGAIEIVHPHGATALLWPQEMPSREPDGRSRGAPYEQRGGLDSAEPLTVLCDVAAEYFCLDRDGAGDAAGGPAEQAVPSLYYAIDEPFGCGPPEANGSFSFNRPTVFKPRHSKRRHVNGLTRNGERPLSVFQSGPLPSRRRLLLGLRLNLPVKNMVAWTQEDEYSLAIEGPASFLSMLSGILAFGGDHGPEGEDEGWRSWLVGWHERVISPSSYFALIALPSGSQKAPGSPKPSTSSEGAKLLRRAGRPGVVGYACYGRPADFTISVCLGARIAGREQYHMDVVR